VRVPDRDAGKAHLESRHVGCAIYYPVPFHEQACFAYLGHRSGEFPHAEKAARETLALPVYGELTAEQQRYVVAVIAEALDRAA
jgi:dTDP-4-amino-4,6-dideoxygalactose transaminase